MTRALVPDDGEVGGLLALMLLTQARSGTREGPDGMLIPLAEQDRRCWDRPLLEEGIELIQETMSSSRLGAYQLQAAIAAVGAAEAATATDTDWPQILKLYDLLQALAPSPVVALNRAVAVAMVDGPVAGLSQLDALSGDRRLSEHHRLASVRAHLQEMAGDTRAAPGSGMKPPPGAPPASRSGATSNPEPTGCAAMSRTRRRLRPEVEPQPRGACRCATSC